MIKALDEGGKTDRIKQSSVSDRRFDYCDAEIPVTAVVRSL